MDGIRQHKAMAEGSGGSYGVEPLSSVNGGHASPDRDMRHKPLGDHERAGAPPVARGAGKMKAAAQPDHGPHRHTGGGLPR